MKNKTLLTCILLLTLICGNAPRCHGASLAISDIRHIGYADGLSNLRVYSIVEDKYHAIWISTKSGIDRYNGQLMKNYRMSDGYYYGDLAARIIQLYYMPDGALWAYDNTGKIYKYSDTYDNFELKTQLSEYISDNITLNKYHITKDGKAFFGLTTGLYTSVNNRIERYIAGLNVNDIVSLGNRLYLGTTTGLKIVNTANRHATGLLDGKSIQTLYYDKERNNIFIGTFNNGLWILNLRTNTLTHVKTDTGLSNKPIRSVTKYDSDILIIGTDGSGIFTYSYSDQSIKKLIDSDDNAGEACLMSNGIYATFMDSSKSLWIGSYTGGVSRINFSKYPITFITHRNKDSKSLVNNNVKSIAEGIDGSLWFATERGISIYRPDSHTWQHLMSDKVCVSLCRTANGDMAVGTYGNGIFITDKNGKVLKHLTKQEDNITSNYIFSIKKDNDGDYWVGSIDGNLMNLDKDWSTGRIEQFASAKEQIKENMSAYIISMLFNKDKTVWLGTEGGGMILYDYAARKIRKHITMNSGLPSNDIFGLIRDREGRIWISTGNGIAVMNRNEIWNLNYIGRIAQEYNKASYVITRSGNILFGSTNGVVELKPSEITRVNYEAPLRLTKFDVDMPDNSSDEFISRIFNMLASKKIRLEHDQNSFNINFESINLSYQNDII